MSLEDALYKEKQKQAEARWEALCGRCGACCGAFDGDPCEHLRMDSSRKYYCAIYNNRFGKHKTVHGAEINCVPIRDILHSSWPGDTCCGYKKERNV